MEKKSLYNQKDFSSTDRSNELFEKIRVVLTPIFQGYLRQGYSPREISHIAAQSAWEMEMDAVIGRL